MAPDDSNGLHAALSSLCVPPNFMGIADVRMQFFATIVARHDQQSAVLKADIMQDLEHMKYIQAHSCKRAHGTYACTHMPE